MILQFGMVRGRRRVRAALFGFGMALVSAGAVAPGQAQVVDGHQLVKAQLIADTQHIQPGQKFRLGVLYAIYPNWHIYWKYAGDAGIPTQIDWQLPPGFRAGPLQWPLPERAKEPGDLEVFDYNNEVLLFTEVQAPEQLPAGPIDLGAKTNWLVCEKQCVPGDAQVSLKLNDGGQGPGNEGLFAKYAASVPKTSPPGYTLALKPSGNQMVVEFSGVPEGSKLDFFPEPPENVVLNHGKQAGNSVVLSVDGGTALTQLKGVAVVQVNGKTDAFEVELRPTAAVAQGGNVSADLAGVLQAIGFALIVEAQPTAGTIAVDTYPRNKYQGQQDYGYRKEWPGDPLENPVVQQHARHAAQQPQRRPQRLHFHIMRAILDHA